MVYDKKDCIIIKKYSGKISPKSFKPYKIKSASNRAIKICNNQFKNDSCESTTICEMLKNSPSINPLSLKPFDKSEENIKNSLISNCKISKKKNSCACIYTLEERKKIKEVCKQFLLNKNINPYTGRKIKKNSKIYNNLIYLCDLCKDDDISELVSESKVENCDNYISIIDNLYYQIEQLNIIKKEQLYKINELFDKIENLENLENLEIIEFEQKIIQLNNEKKELEEIVLNIKQELRDLEIFSENLKIEIQSISEKYSDSENLNEYIKDQIREAEENYENLNNEYILLLENFNNIIEEFQNQSKIIDSLNNQLEINEIKYLEIIKAFDEELALKNNELTTLENYYINLENNFELIQQENDELKNLQSNNQNEELLEYVREYNERLNQEIEKIKQLKLENKKLRKENKENLYEKDEYLQKLQLYEKIISECKDLKEKYVNMEKNNEQLTKEFNDKDLKYNKLLNKFEEYKIQCSNIKKNFQNCSQNLENLQYEFEFINKQIQEKERLLELSNQEKEKIKNDLKNIGEYISKDEHEKELMKVKQGTKQIILEQKSINDVLIQKLNDEISILESEINKLKNIKCYTQNQYDDILNQIKENADIQLSYEKVIDDLTQENVSLKIILRNLESKRCFTEDEFKEFLNNIESETSKIISIDRDKIIELNKEKENLLYKIQKLESIKVLSVSEYKDTIKNLNNKVNRLDDEIRSLSIDINFLKREKSEIENKYKIYDNYINTIVDKLNEIALQLEISPINNNLSVLDIIENIENNIRKLNSENKYLKEYVIDQKIQPKAEIYENELNSIRLKLNSIISDYKLNIKLIRNNSEIISKIEEIITNFK